MNCKACGYPSSRVIETKHTDNDDQIYRRRECIKCGARYTTQEHARQDYKRGGPYKTTPPRKVLEK